MGCAAELHTIIMQYIGGVTGCQRDAQFDWSSSREELRGKLPRADPISDRSEVLS